MTLQLTTTNDTTALHTLMDMLTYRRPSGSVTEAEFCREYIIPLGCEIDRANNFWLEVGNCNRVLYSCHYDTVHRRDGRQVISAYGGKGGIWLNDSDSNCLGADCTVGVWLMREMILAKVPGLYIFHAAEECGGRGSQFIADTYPDHLKTIRAAIAFDRRGRRDIITHQGYGRTASDKFAWSLAAQLDMGYLPSMHGIFTDTANYQGIIPECTNVSVGYEGEHTPEEVLDINHAMRLRNRLILGLDESKLVIERNPTTIETADWHDWYEYDGYDQSGSRTLLDIVKLYPDMVADWLERAGYDAHSLLDELEK